MSHLPLDDFFRLSGLFGRAPRFLVRPERVADRRERIAQFVRQQRQELVLATIGEAQGFFALPQLLLRQLTLGDVPRDLGGGNDRAVGGADRGDREGDRDPPAIFGDAHRVEVIDALATPQLGEDLLLFGVEPWRDDDGDWLADDLVRFVTEDPHSTAVPGEDASLERLADDRVVR